MCFFFVFSLRCPYIPIPYIFLRPTFSLFPDPRGPSAFLPFLGWTLPIYYLDKALPIYYFDNAAFSLLLQLGWDLHQLYWGEDPLTTLKTRLVPLMRYILYLPGIQFYGLTWWRSNKRNLGKPVNSLFVLEILQIFLEGCGVICFSVMSTVNLGSLSTIKRSCAFNLSYIHLGFYLKNSLCYSCS